MLFLREYNIEVGCNGLHKLLYLQTLWRVLAGTLLGSKLCWLPRAGMYRAAVLWSACQHTTIMCIYIYIIYWEPQMVWAGYLDTIPRNVFLVMERRCSLLWKGGVPCYGKEVFLVMERRFSLFWKGGISCHGRRYFVSWKEVSCVMGAGILFVTHAVISWSEFTLSDGYSGAVHVAQMRTAWISQVYCRQGIAIFRGGRCASINTSQVR